LIWVWLAKAIEPIWRSQLTINDQPLRLFPNGLYDLLLTKGVESSVADYEYVSAPEINGDAFAQLISDLVSAELPIAMRGLKTTDAQVEFANRILGLISPGTSVEKLSALRALVKNAKDDHSIIAVEPELPLGDFALLTNANGEPSMLSQLREELMSADGVDILIAFVFQTGLNTFADLIRKLRARKVRVRLITGVYRGSSEQKAINYLVEELGVEVKINYETHKNHLHAKAWIIHRNSGFTTAFVGSSNISVAAMETGLEWNVRLTKARSPHVLKKLTETFETYWTLPRFESYDPATDQVRLAQALASAGAGNVPSSDFNFFGIDVTAKPHQEQMLLDLENERTIHDRHKNLVVAATGTGKTVLAALDYRNLIRSKGILPKLLFVAHRKEILLQARATFRAVLKNGEFGEVWADGQKPTQWQHVFASVQAIAKQGALADFSPDHFEILVIDEFHHAEAKSYRGLLEHFTPLEMVGLTATPERGDGVRVQDQFFDGRIATELRLWDALDSGLLAPFHYFGIGEGTDFKNVEWKSGGYDTGALSNLLTGNDVRDRLVLREIREKLPTHWQ
jgi:HKD family nuclease